MKPSPRPPNATRALLLVGGVGVAGVLGLAVVLALSSVGDTSTDRSCTAEAAPLAEAKSATDPQARLFWDDSGSMARFYGRKAEGPYARLGRRMENTLLPAVGIFKYSHAYVGDRLVASANYRDPAFESEFSDLLQVATVMAESLKSTGPEVSIFLSDLIVETPPASRAASEGTACGVTLPQSSFAPYHFAACLGEATKDIPETERFVSVVRVAEPEHGGMYALVVSRDPTLGRKVSAQIGVELQQWNPTELVLVDTATAPGSTTSLSCTSSASDPVFMGGADQGDCRFRYRFTETSSHPLRCGIEPAAPSDAVVQVVATGLLVDGQEARLDDRREATLTLPRTKGDVVVQVGNAFVAPDDDEVTARITAFVHPPTEPPSPLTDREGHVLEVLTSLTRVLADHAAPPGRSSIVRYQ